MVLMLTVLGIMTFASCNKDDTETIDNAYGYLHHTFTGKLICQSETRTDSVVMDTLDASWSISSANRLTLSGVPIAKLLVGVDNAELTAAAAEMATQTVTADIAVTHLSPIVFSVTPQPLTATAHYGGADHTLRITFAYSASQSWGSYSTNDNAMVINIIETGVYLDGNSDNILPASKPLLWSTEQQVKAL